MRERIGLAAHRGEGPDGVAAASVDAASRFARSVGDALTRKVEALELIAADVGTRTADLEHMSLARAAWELASMYFVEPGDGTGVVTERLVEWYRRNGAALNFGGPGALPVRLRSLIDGVADAGDRPESAPMFWECLAGLVAMGWSDAAADLVALHSCWAEWRQGMAAAKPAAELLEACVALIRTAPRMATAEDAGAGTNDAYPASVATSVPQFMAFREAWSRQVRDVLNDGALFDAVTDAHTSEGARATLEVLAGETTALARACEGGWLELMVASARHSYPTLRAGEHAGLMSQCVGVTGPGTSPELDELLGAIISVDTERTAAVCAKYFSPWFIAHLSEMLVAAAGQGYLVGATGGDALGAPSVLRAPAPQMAGSTTAESHMMNYCASLATRSTTRRLALRYLPHCATRGAGVAARILRKECPPPGSLIDPNAEHADPDVAFAKTLGALEACRGAGLVDATLGVARSAAADARARGDQEGAVAWLHRAGDVRGVAALALEQLPTAHQASVDPSDAAATLVRLAAGHPGAEAGLNAGGDAAAIADGEWRSVGAVAAAGPAWFLDALAALRGALTELVRAGTTERYAAGAKRVVGSAQVAAAARRAGGSLVALVGHSAGQAHLWTEALFHAVPLLEGAHVALTPKEIQLCMARLEQVSGAGVGTKGDLRVADDEGVMNEFDLRAAAARTALARAYARACVTGAGGSRGIGVR